MANSMVSLMVLANLVEGWGDAMVRSSIEKEGDWVLLSTIHQAFTDELLKDVD